MTKKELKIPSVSSYTWWKKTEIHRDFSDILFLNSRITNKVNFECMKVIISGKGQTYYPNNKLMLHSDLFIIGTQVSQFDLPRVSIICILLNLTSISACLPLSPPTPLPEAWPLNTRRNYSTRGDPRLTSLHSGFSHSAISAFNTIPKVLLYPLSLNLRSLPGPSTFD